METAPAPDWVTQATMVSSPWVGRDWWRWCRDRSDGGGREGEEEETEEGQEEGQEEEEEEERVEARSDDEWGVENGNDKEDKDGRSWW